MQPGDLIKEVNRVSVSTTREFHHHVARLGSGESVALLVRRELLSGLALGAIAFVRIILWPHHAALYGQHYLLAFLIDLMQNICRPCQALLMTKLQKYSHLIHWGTSTWTYPEWQGIVYQKAYTAKSIKSESLAEYAAFKPFSTVGIDNTFYAPPNPFVLEEYAKHLPNGFKCVSKVWEEFTVPKWSNQKRYGKKAGKDNPHFLDAEKFKTAVLGVYEMAFKQHTGPLVFEFGEMYPPAIPSLAFFLEKLQGFFSALPGDYEYAVELRNKAFLKPEYFATLRRHNVSHVFNHWTKMPRLIEQAAAAGENPFTANFGVARLLTPLGIKYEKAVEMNAPYNALKARLPMMRDDIEELIDKALEFNIPFYILINNRTEGCAPMTVQELDQRLHDKYE